MSSETKAPELSPAERVRVEAFGFDKPPGIDEVAELIAYRATDIAERSRNLLGLVGDPVE